MSSSRRPPASPELFPPTSMPPGSLAARAWEDGITVLSLDEVEEMTPSDRVAYLRVLHNWQMDQGITNGPYQEWRAFERKCRMVTDEVNGERCWRDKWESSPRCLQHSSVDEIDPKGAEDRRRAAARARAAKLTETALDELEKLLTAPDSEIGPSVRMKAIEAVLDRGGLPKRTETKQEVSGEVTHTVEAGQVIDARLDRLRESMINRELAGIEEATDAEVIEVVEAETEDLDDGS